MIKTWDEVKQSGSTHYKTGDIEPIDLYRSLGTLRDFALMSIVKYAIRNIDREQPIKNKDMRKIQHYCDMLLSAYGETEEA
jgi:hypothetical protein